MQRGDDETPCGAALRAGRRGREDDVRGDRDASHLRTRISPTVTRLANDRRPGRGRADQRGPPRARAAPSGPGVIRLSPHDADYPRRLRTLKRRPDPLWVWGALPDERTPTVGI